MTCRSIRATGFTSIAVCTKLMLQFEVTDGPAAVRSVVCANVPFSIGRTSEANLHLSAPGVWEEHARVVRDTPSGKLAIQPVGEALLLINGQRSDGKILVPGDEIQIGAVHIMVGFAAVSQKGLGPVEGLVWCFLFIVVALQGALLAALR